MEASRDGQRPGPRARRRRRARHPARLAARHRLTGSKEGCAEGECGACAVMVARPDGEGPYPLDRDQRLPGAGRRLDNQEVITAEGLGDAGALHPVQRRWPTAAARSAVTAHRVSSARWPRSTTGRTGGRGEAGGRRDEPDRAAAAATLRPTPTRRPGHAPDHEHGPNGFDLHALSGNLCRCTGYRPIRDAAYALGAARREPTRCSRRAATGRRRPRRRPGSPAARARFVRPADLAEALDLLAEHPDARLVAGSTDWGVELNIRHARAALTIGIDRLTELRQPRRRRRPHRHRRRPDPVRDRARPGRPGAAAGRAVPAVRVPADPQRRHPRRQPRHRLADRRQPAGAAGAGRLAGARLPRRRARGAAGRLLHRLPADRQAPGRADQDHPIPLPVAPISAFHKIAKRRFDDISSVAVAFRAAAGRPDVGRADIKIGLGGVAATPLRAPATEDALTGRPGRATWSARPPRCWPARAPRSSDHRASAAYRTAMLRHVAAQVLRREPGESSAEPASSRRPERHEQGTRTAGRPAEQPEGRAGDLARERRPARHRQGAVHPGPGRPDQGHAARLAACRRRTRTPWSPSCGSTPAYAGARRGPGC